MRSFIFEISAETKLNSSLTLFNLSILLIILDEHFSAGSEFWIPLTRIKRNQL